MLELIFTLIIGIFIAIFALNNTNTVTLLLGNYVLSDIPLYLVIVGSLLTGIVVSWIIHLLQWVGTVLEMHGKDNSIKSAQREIEKLNERIQVLEMENARLKDATSIAPTFSHPDKEFEHRPNFLETLRHRFHFQ